MTQHFHVMKKKVFRRKSWKYFDGIWTIYETKQIISERENRKKWLSKITNCQLLWIENHLLKPTDESTCLDVIFAEELTYQKQLNNMIRKMAIAIRSIYLVRSQIPLKAPIDLFKSVVLSDLELSAKFFFIVFHPTQLKE